MAAGENDDERSIGARQDELLAASLIDQVADPQALRRDQLLQATAIGVTSVTGDAFFRLLARHLAHTLQCACAVVGVLSGPSGNRARTLAFFADHQWLANFEYDLAGTPCENVVARSLCIYPREVQRLFPQDQWLRDQRIESYGGTPLYDSREQVLGLISVLSRAPMEDTDSVRFALQIFAARAAAEIERQQTEESLRASQAALAESEERFRQMAETIRDLFWLYDVRERRMLYVSPAYEAIWGRSAEWIYEDPIRWLEAVYEDDRKLAGVAPSPSAPGKFFDAEYRIVLPDGTLRWIHDRRYAVFDEAGQYVRVVGVAKDISERHEAAERLEQQSSHLAHIARLSTVGELVASIAHEVNQPLYAIANFSSAIAAALERGGELPRGDVARWNDEIGKAVSRAGDIIRRVRSYVTRGPLVRQPIDLVEVVRESAALLASEARRQRVRIDLVLEGAMRSLLADPIAIQQVLVNLLRNGLEASKETPNGGRVVTIRTRMEEAQVEIIVEDAGDGLSDEDLAQLFSAFYTSKPHGMGLGLAISKTIVEAHGGRIWATRNAERGSTFHFTLPLPGEVRV